MFFIYHFCKRLLSFFSLSVLFVLVVINKENVLFKKLTLISTIIVSSFGATANSLTPTHDIDVSNSLTDNYSEVQAMGASSNQNIINELKVLFDQTFTKGQLLAINFEDPIFLQRMYGRFGAIDGLVSMYRATNDTKYIDDAIAVSERYFAQGKTDKYGYKYWGKVIDTVDGKDRDGTYQYEWRAGAAIAKILIALASDPNRGKYNDRLIALANELEAHVWRKWNSGIEEYIDGAPQYRDPQQNQTPHMTARLSLIALALQKWKLSGEYVDFLRARSTLMIADSDIYTTLAGKQAYCIKLYNSDRGYSCNTSQNVDDVSHARDVVDYIFTVVELDKYGSTYSYGKYTYQDLQQIYNTSRYALLDSSVPSNFQFRDYVININNIPGKLTGHDVIDKKNTSIGGIYSSLQGSWAKFAKQNAELRSIYYSFLKQGGIVCDIAGTRYADSNGNKSGKCNGELWDFEQAHFIGSLALAYKLAGK